MIDLGDLFCELFDELDESEFRSQGESWTIDPSVSAAAREVETGALDGTLTGAAVRQRIDSTPAGKRSRLRFAVLRGIDAALASANPLFGTSGAGEVSDYALRYAEAGRLDSGTVAGGLLPRFATPGRRGQLPDHLADAFGSVVRVSPQAWAACDHMTLPAHARLTRTDRAAGLRVGTTPLIRDPGELHWEVHERGGLRFYRIHPADLEPTQQRIERVVAGWRNQGVAIGMAPELCLSPRLLERWGTALRAAAGGTSSSLRLVLAGSGNTEGTEPPVNEAVLMDALTGEAIVRQRKVHPFNFSPADIELWGLGDRFEAPIDEDLARLHMFSAAIHAHGVSVILVPVFARPTKDRRWERAKAEIYSDATGSNVVVANSLVMAAVLGASGPVGTAIAVAPGEAAVGHAAEPDDVVAFLLDAGAPAVTHERPTAIRE